MLTTKNFKLRRFADGSGAASYDGEEGETILDLQNKKLKIYFGDGAENAVDIPTQEQVTEIVNTAIEESGGTTPPPPTVSATPSITIASGVSEQVAMNGTINNYSVNITYVIAADRGIISNVSNGSFTYTAPMLTGNTDEFDYIRVRATETGKTQSAAFVKEITVYRILETPDGQIINTDFATNALFNTGFSY